MVKRCGVEGGQDRCSTKATKDVSQDWKHVRIKNKPEELKYLAPALMTLGRTFTCADAITSLPSEFAPKAIFHS